MKGYWRNAAEPVDPFRLEGKRCPHGVRMVSKGKSSPGEGEKTGTQSKRGRWPVGNGDDWDNTFARRGGVEKRPVEISVSRPRLE